jgi:hypothetical protein
LADGLYKALLLVLYRSREERAPVPSALTEASMHATRRGARILVDRSRTAVPGALRAPHSLLLAELRLSCP